MKRLYGIVIPMLTPLTEDDQVDAVSLRKLTDRCIEKGAHCLYPCGTTGEMMYLSIEERKQAAETVIQQTDGRVPVFVHVGAWNLKDTICLAKHAAETGADGIGIVTPVFYSVSDSGLVDYFTEIANSVPKDFPVYLYGIKQNAVNDINRQVCEEVAKRCPNVIGAKYSYPDMTRIQELTTIAGGSFDVLVGPDHLLTASAAIGVKGTVSGNAMCIPEHYQMLWECLEKKDFQRALAVQKRTNILNSLMMDTGKNIAVYKMLLKKEGVIACEKMRKPLEQLTKEEETFVGEKMKEFHYRECIC